jgi:hypothetical protein
MVDNWGRRFIAEIGRQPATVPVRDGFADRRRPGQPERRWDR